MRAGDRGGFALLRLWNMQIGSLCSDERKRCLFTVQGTIAPPSSLARGITCKPPRSQSEWHTGLSRKLGGSRVSRY